MRRKKKFILLKGKRGHFIVGSREWYDEKRVRRDRHWKIVAQSDDEETLTTMAMLTDKHLGMSVINTIEEN
jgi:hypothetical protein